LNTTYAAELMFGYFGVEFIFCYISFACIPGITKIIIETTFQGCYAPPESN
jgi:hypothetical protein